MGSTSKTATIKGKNLKGNTVKLQIPGNSKKVTASNELNSFNRPITDPVENDSRETRALNMNRISLEVQTTAKISDEYADKNHNGAGDKPDLSSKEEWINQLYLLFVANEILELKFTNSDTFAQTAEFSGYISGLDWQEKMQNQSSIYDVTINFKDVVEMNS